MNRDVAEFFERFRTEILGSIFTGTIASVQSFTREPLEATVVPMLNVVDGQGAPFPMPPITLPVNVMWAGNCFIIPDYQPGDLVWLAPNINDFAKVLSSGVNITMNNSYHGLENMVVAFGIKKDATPIPTSLPPTGIVIGDSTGQAYINVGKEGIDVVAPKVSVTTTADVAIKASGQVTVDSPTVMVKGSTDVSVEAQNVKVTGSTGVKVNSDAVEIGSSTGVMESSVLGEKLKTALEDLATMMTNATAPSSGGAIVWGSSLPSAWSANLQSILSTGVKNA